MIERIQDCWTNLVQRMRRAWTQCQTWFNGLFTIIALYVMSHHDVHEKLLPFIPEDYRSMASVLLPIILFWFAQKGKEIDRERTIVQTRLAQ